MKKSLLIISALFLAGLSTNAQITITSADIASPITVIMQAHDTLPTVSAGSAGTSQTWNMTALNTSIPDDTLNFISASWAPKVSQYPGTNLALKFASQNAYGYIVKTSTSLTLLGNSTVMDFGGGPSDIVQKNTPAEKITDFPAVYSSTFSNNFTTEAIFFFGIDPGIGATIDSVHQKSMVQKTVTVDAWGTITTPLGSFASLRYKTIKHQTDSTWVKAFGTWNFFQEKIDSSKQYAWWANGIGFSLVDATVDFNTGVVKSVDWLRATPAAGINEYVNAENINVYPNPAQNEITFAVGSGKAVSIQVFDITGKMINSYPVSSDNASINISAFANGAYMYSVIGKDNTVLNRGKFTVAK